MITKVTKILNVGRLSDVGGTSDVHNLAKNTFIYSSNAHGKSTFVSILRSIGSGNPNLILGRKTLGSVNDPKIILKLDNNGDKAIFENKKWNKELPYIRIFDSKYINESFFSPDQQIDSNGQQRIETFILGEEGKKIGERISALITKQTENKNAKSDITREYNTNKQQDWPTVFDKFIKIDKIDNLEIAIKTEKDNLTSYENQTQIQQLLNGIKNIIDSFDSGSIRKNLSERLEVDTSQITEHMKKHLASDADKRIASDFFEKGTTISEKNPNHCVYCGQTLSGSAKTLLTVYEHIYNDKYKTLSQNARSAKNLFETTKIVDNIRKSFDDLTDLKAPAALPTVKDDQNNNIAVLEYLQNNISKFSDEIRLKCNDLNHSVDFTSLDAIDSGLDTINKILLDLISKYSGDVSERVKLCNSKITEYKINQARFSELWTKYCKDYLDLNESGKIISQNLSDLYKEQKDYAETLLNDCQILINQCLSGHGANFKIDNLISKGRTRGELFQLVFDSNKDPVGLTGDDGQCSIKNTLSESDKRLLCFAFFMASIEKEQKPSQLIVVLDDPMSSFDYERRNSMVDYLQNFTARVGVDQMIILSHDKYFIKLLDEKVSSSDKSIRQLLWRANASKETSNFITLDTQSDPMFIDDDYYRYRQKLIDYKAMNDNDILDKTENLSYIRKILEFILKHKYYDILESDIKDSGSVTAFVDTLSKPGNPYYATNMKKRIAALTPHKPNHDPNPSDFPIDRWGAIDIRKIIDDTFKLVKEL